MKKNNIKKRPYPEIDMMRGIATLAMIAFHTAFIAQFSFNKYISSSLYVWQGIPTLIAGTFLTVAGLCLYIGQQRGKYPSLSVLLKRSGFIFSLGLLFTVFTYFFDEWGVVYFGVLHCIGLATLISFYLLPLPKHVTLVIGCLVVGIGEYMEFSQQTCLHASLFWLYPCYCSNLKPMLDYYPLIPSLGFMLIGIFLGKKYYPQGQRIFYFKISPPVASWLYPISFLGKHSLLIYCMHTSIIFAVLYLVLS